MLRATTACTFSTSKLQKVVRQWCFVHFDLEMCFAPQRGALFRHLNCQKMPKVARTPSVLYMLTWKCASRHNGVHFFDISTSKSGPKWCFVHFDLEMCFAPQRGALFRHLNCQKMPKVARTPSVLYMLTWKCASRHNGVHFFDISTSKSGPELVCFVHFDLEVCFAPQRRAIVYLYLASWLRTRRFSEPTFRPSGATNHWKNTMNRDIPTFSRTCIFFLLIFLF